MNEEEQLKTVKSSKKGWLGNRVHRQPDGGGGINSKYILIELGLTQLKDNKRKLSKEEFRYLWLQEE